MFGQNGLTLPIPVTAIDRDGTQMPGPGVRQPPSWVVTPSHFLHAASAWLCAHSCSVSSLYGPRNTISGAVSCLTVCCRNQYSRNQAPHSESWRTQVYYAGGPRGVKTPSSEPRTKGLQSFYTWTGMIKRVCGFAGARAIAGEGNGTPLQYSRLENPMDGGAWQAAVHGVSRSQSGLSDFTFPFHFYALEKEMATLSSVLAWRIPGTGEPSTGSHRVGHD